MTIVPKAGVRNRGWILAKTLGIAPAAAIESDVREPGRIVVWADEMPEMMTASTRSLPSSEPSTSEPTVPSTPASSSNFSTWPRPA